MSRIFLHRFTEPASVELPNYPRPFRVLAVEYRRNPVDRKFHAYAIAEWHFANQWRPMTDLATLMRLANQVEHPFPRNPEHYANAW